MSGRADQIILVYNAESGLRAMLLDVVKKAVGREDCSLCEITYGALGKRAAWSACEERLGTPVEELHRDQLPVEWGIAPGELPCILGRSGGGRPFVLVARDEIAACGGRIDRLEERLRVALDGGRPPTEIRS
ncbi:MAG TPA: hypothetical protein VF334_18940 [Polyangia bacterium]